MGYCIWGYYPLVGYFFGLCLSHRCTKLYIESDGSILGRFYGNIIYMGGTMKNVGRGIIGLVFGVS